MKTISKLNAVFVGLEITFCCVVLLVHVAIVFFANRIFSASFWSICRDGLTLVLKMLFALLLTPSVDFLNQKFT